MSAASHFPDQPDTHEWTPGERVLKRVKVGDTSIEIERMIHRGPEISRQPLVILNSIDLPMPPSHAFCEHMWSAGYQVIFIRRAGFGPTACLPSILLSSQEVRKLAPVAAEAAMLSLYFDSLQLENIVLLGLGTSNSICRRLTQMSPRLQLSIYSNPLFHPDIWGVIRPAWLKRMIRQTLLSKSGLKIAVRGLKAVLRRDPLWFYRQFAQKSAGDLNYISENLEDFRQAGQCLQDLPPDVFYYELQTALISDTAWPASVTRGSAATILSGRETTTLWQSKIKAEAGKLGLPIVFADSGDLFVPYTSPDLLVQIIRDHVANPAQSALG